MTLNEAIVSTSAGLAQLSRHANDRRKTRLGSGTDRAQRNDEADDLVARHCGSDATDRQIRARHQPTANVTGEDDAVVRAAEVIYRDDDRERSTPAPQPRNSQLARNFPTIACHAVIGIVSKSSIVPTRRSSAQSRIPTAGTRNK